PERSIPAKRPFAREYDSISADIWASVAAVAPRPTGPAAIEASAPSVTLFESSFSTPRLFITTRTSSVDCTPACSPMLPLVRSMKIGGPQPLACLQLRTPDPDSPPTTKPAFLSDGITTTHSALLQMASGIPLSGAFRISESAAVALLTCLMSSFDSWAYAVV